MKKRVKCDAEQSSFSTNENERVQKDNCTDRVLMVQVPLQTAWETRMCRNIGVMWEHTYITDGNADAHQ